MNKSISKSLLFLLFIGLMACKSTPESSRPKLQVLVVVDGLRADLLQRYDEAFQHGLRRLLDQGAIFSKAYQDHGMTVTAAGHTSISTGVFPKTHGIVANSWKEIGPEGWREAYAVEDPEYQIVGMPDEEGRSPRKIEVKGMADWLKAQHPDSKVVSISGKDRAAISMATHSTGHVYWFDDNFAGFGTSTYYRNQNPAWVTDFNSQLIANYFNDVWSCDVPENLRHLARKDSAAYEADGKFIAFPHKMSVAWANEGIDLNDDEVKASWMEDQPMVDKLVFDFAKEAVKALALGKQDSPDFLALGLSATDRVNHAYGPLSLEAMDNLLKLDKELGLLLDYLDEQVGKDQYVLALSADHGFNDAPEHRQAQGKVGLRVTDEEIEVLVGKISPLDFVNDYAKALVKARQILDATGFVARTFTAEEMEADAGADSLHILWKRSYFPGRVASELAEIGLVAIEVTEGTETRTFGSSHGTHYAYDRQVPIIFYGGGIKPGVYGSKARTVDIAPTMSQLFNIPFPDDLDGKVLPLEK